LWGLLVSVAPVLLSSFVVIRFHMIGRTVLLVPERMCAGLLTPIILNPRPRVHLIPTIASGCRRVVVLSSTAGGGGGRLVSISIVRTHTHTHMTYVRRFGRFVFWSGRYVSARVRGKPVGLSVVGARGGALQVGIKLTRSP
jgi:hypothetical protein